MEHITVTELSSGYKKLTPDNGYMLRFETSNILHSEAYVHETKGWAAVKV